MIKVKNCINTLKNCYQNNKQKEHIELKQCFDISTTVYNSSDPEKPLLVAGFTGDYSFTLMLLSIIFASIFAMIFTTKMIKKLSKYISCIFRHR